MMEDTPDGLGNAVALALRLPRRLPWAHLGKDPKTMTSGKWLSVATTLILIATVASAQELRTTLSLDGTWEIAQGTLDRQPERFEHHVPVPGLVDMAQPAFAEVGVKSQLRQAFWYRKTFNLDRSVPAVAQLKIHKAAYGTRAFLNGKLLGDHLPSFTPGYFDVRDALRPGNNELIIRVGSFRDSLPPHVPAGWDYEKIRYTPGIFDSVELILSGTPNILNLQAVPNIEKQTVTVHTFLRNAGPQTSATVNFTIRQAKTGQVVAQVQSQPLDLAPGQESTFAVEIPIPNCRLWSPEDPFLYELIATTSADQFTTRFGMRSFHFDPATGRAMLNGKPYFMRGTNVTLYRFFEDPNRTDKPWRPEWVRRLHQSFKPMHWNSIRYCIGFPPEFWYRIADEEGFLIQDEFPIWNMDAKAITFTSEELGKEYTEWMRERWNHPSVVIWDAQNESKSEQTGKAIQAVRHLDFSNRPFDNGWSPAQAPGDSFESHPYLFQNPSFKLRDIARVSGVPRGNALENKGKNPIIINEYCWLWLNRDGSPTTLTKDLYRNLLGPDSTPDQRRYLHARYVAALTEFWRCNRACAGVLHFCSLGYARPDGQTCDDYLDLEKLNFEPNFQKYVADAFSPVALMIDQWADEYPAGKSQQFPVVVINDLHESWMGTVRLRLVRGSDVIEETTQPCELPPLGDKRLVFALTIPAQPGAYQVQAALIKPGSAPIQSLRDFEVLTEQQKVARVGLSVGKPVSASSNLTKDGQSYPAHYAVDDNPQTRWSSEFSDPQSLTVDLGTSQTISRVVLNWETAAAKAYSIDVSTDGQTWKSVHTTTAGQGGAETIRFAPTPARWVRLLCTQRTTPFGYSLWDLKIFP
ncbi:MAG TPA: discoidin domain-containing protein [Tepidisphaeraceae bacterium]|nr:discoidin domain-containing protein [Tepidisphaeraceae bacterium]